MAEEIPTYDEEYEVGPDAIPVHIAPKILREITYQRPTFEQLVDDNRQYLDFLEAEIGGEEASVQQRQIHQLIAKAPRTGTKMKPELRMLGNIAIWPYTSKSKDFKNPSDPINLIFWKSGNADSISDRLLNEFLPHWYDTVQLSEAQYTYVDGSRVGGGQDWVLANYSIANCSVYASMRQERCHIRLFECPNIEPTLGTITLAAVHYETPFLSFPPHKVRDWDGSQQFVSFIFASLLPYVGDKTRERLQGKGEVLQQISHDGIADSTEIT